MHLDGARFFNAIVETGDNPKAFGKYFDTISICLSKGLGAPVGSVILCSKKNELQARRIRKVFGGGMRQAGYMAAAAIFGLDNHVDRLKEDHHKAKKIGEALSQLSWVESVMPVDTNIVIFSVTKATPEKILQILADHNIKALKFGPQEIRMVTHLDFDEKMLDKTIEVFRKITL